MFKKTILAIALVLWGSSIAHAAPAMPEGPAPQGMFETGPGLFPIMALDLMDISAQQREQLVTLFRKKVDELTAQEEKRFATMRSLREGIMHGDVELVRSLVNSKADERQEEIIGLAIFMADFRAILTESQRSRLDTAMQRIAELKSSPEGNERIEKWKAKRRRQRSAPEKDGEEMRPGPDRLPPLVELRRMLETWLAQNG